MGELGLPGKQTLPKTLVVCWRIISAPLKEGPGKPVVGHGTPGLPSDRGGGGRGFGQGCFSPTVDLVKS